MGTNYMTTKTRRVCGCYWVKPSGMMMLGVTITYPGGVLGYVHNVVCHPQCADQGPGFCTDETYLDDETETINHNECGLPIPKRAWLHCGPC